MIKSIPVSCIYNSEIIAMLKQWRNEDGGRFDQKYCSWNYWQPFSTTGLERLKQMHPPKDIKHHQVLYFFRNLKPHIKLFNQLACLDHQVSEHIIPLKQLNLIVW